MSYKLLVETVVKGPGTNVNVAYALALTSIVVDFESESEANDAFDHINSEPTGDHSIAVKLSRKAIKLY